MKHAILFLSLILQGAIALAQNPYCQEFDIPSGQSGLKSVCMTLQSTIQDCEPIFVYNLNGPLSAAALESLNNISPFSTYQMWEDAYNTSVPQMIIEVTHQCSYSFFETPCVIDPYNYPNNDVFVTFGGESYSSYSWDQTISPTTFDDETLMYTKTRTTTYTIPLYADHPTIQGNQSQLLKITDADYDYQFGQWPGYVYGEFAAMVTVYGDEIVSDPLWTTQAPTLPTLILRDPPGDQSYAYLAESSETCHGYGMSIGSANSTEAWASVKLGTSGSVGIIAETEYEVYAEISGGVEIGVTRTSSEEYEMCYSTTTEYQTNPENGLIGNGDDVFIGTATNYAYGMYRTFSPNGACSYPIISNELILSPIGTTNTVIYTQDHIENNIIPTIESNLSTLNPESLTYETLSDQLEVWQQAIAINEELKAEATYTQGTSFVGGPGFDYNVSLTTSSIKSIEMNMYIDENVAAEVGAEVAGVGASGGVRVRARTDQGSSSFSSNQSTNTVGYHLQDDDATDNFTMDIRSDNAFGTPVFVLNDLMSESSCPYEGGFQIDQPMLTFADGSSNLTLQNIPNGTQPTFQIGVCNNSNYDRYYNLKVNPSSNTEGAILQGFGENLSSSDFGFEIYLPANECIDNATITLTQPSTQNLEYEGIELYLYAFCQPAAEPIYTSIFLDAYFVDQNGVDESDATNFRIYPNPNHGNFRIEASKNFAGSDLKIYDLSGRVVFQTLIAKSDMIEINQDQLPAGMYLVEIASESGTQKRRIFIN